MGPRAASTAGQAALQRARSASGTPPTTGSDDAMVEAAIAARKAQEADPASTYPADQSTTPAGRYSSQSLPFDKHRRWVAARYGRYAPNAAGINACGTSSSGTASCGTYSCSSTAPLRPDTFEIDDPGPSPSAASPSSLTITESAVMAVVSLTDFVLHCFLSGRVAAQHGTSAAKPFALAIAFALLMSVLLVVAVVARLGSSGGASASGFHARLAAHFHSTIALLMASIVHPELLRHLAPASQHATILIMDAVRFVVEGVPFMILSALLIAREGLGDRYGINHRSNGSLTMIFSDPCRGVALTAPPPLTAPAAPPPPFPPASPLPPLPPPPPPFPPTDPSGDTSRLAITVLGWTTLVLVLKLLRLIMHAYAHVHTTALRQEVSHLAACLEDERRARAAEQAEIASLRQHVAQHRQQQAADVVQPESPTPFRLPEGLSRAASCGA